MPENLGYLEFLQKSRLGGKPGHALGEDAVTENHDRRDRGDAVCLGNATSGTVTVSTGSGAVVQASGEGGQRLDKKTIERAVSTGRGLPKNILAGNKSHSRFIPPEIAIGLPPAVNVSAGSGRPGGLATEVNIK